MKKTKLTRSLLAACSIVALSAVMYGCTSDGSKDELVATQEALDQEKADHADTQADLDTANADLDTAKADVMRLEGELTTAEGERDAAGLEVTRLEGELLTAEGDVTRLEGELLTAEGERDAADLEVTRLEGELTQAETDRDHYKGIVDAATGEGVPQDVQAEAMLIAGAIGPDSTKADSSTDTGTQMPFHVDGGTFREAETATETTDDDYTMSMDAPSTISGWAGSMHTRETTEDVLTTTDANESVMDTAVVYTDQAEPTDDTYANHYQLSSADTRDGIDQIADDADDDLNVLTFETDVSEISDLIDVSVFPSGDRQTFTFEDDPLTTDEDEDERVLMGMFHGVPGTFACTSDPCTATTDKDGNVITLSAGWTFTPDEQDDDDDPYMVAGVVPDPDYLTMGYWLSTDFGGKEGAMRHQALAFAMGNTVHNAQVTGSATYAGPATGLYMRKVLDSSGNVTPVESGQFTADASLTAYFGQTVDDVDTTDVNEAGTIAPNVENTISGMVSGFEDSDGNTIDAAWTVELMKAAIENGGDFTGMTTGMGTYDGQFYGPATDDDGPLMPSSAAGTFDGHFANGHVYGAFGARKE